MVDKTPIPVPKEKQMAMTPEAKVKKKVAAALSSWVLITFTP